MFKNLFLLNLLMFFSFSNIFFASSSHCRKNNANKERSDLVMSSIYAENYKDQKERCYFTCIISGIFIATLGTVSAINSSSNNRLILSFDNKTSSKLDSRLFANTDDVSLSNSTSQVYFPNASDAVCSVRKVVNTRLLRYIQKKEQDKLSRLSPAEKRRQKILRK